MPACVSVRYQADDREKPTRISSASGDASIASQNGRLEKADRPVR